MFILTDDIKQEAPVNDSKSKEGLSKKTIDIIRTTQRNNIELTAIADNKANVLLSLNAIIIAALAPLVISNLDAVYEHHLLIPLSILSLTCFSTIYLAAKVLKPSKLNGKREGFAPEIHASPFFFGNFYQMESTEYYEYLNRGLSDPALIKAHMAQDLFYIGKRLGFKMSWIRKAFHIFTFGVFLTMVSLAWTLFVQ